MYRYISLVWNEADPQLAETAKFLKGYFEGTETSWEAAYEGRGLLVLHTGEEKNRMQAYPLRTQEGKSGGVVLGKLLKRERAPEAISNNADLSTGEARKVIHSAGRHLVDDYWGTYVAFFQDGPRKYVQVDPIGIFSCFRTSYRGVEIYFTYMPDVASCKFLNFSVDWTILARGLLHVIDKTKVPISEITKILGGECLTITPHETTKVTYWNPQKISQTDVIEDMEEAARTLRQTTLSTVAAMAEPYDNVMNQIGGLDSSILLASLKQIPTPLEVSAYNYHMDDRTMDERYYVRQTTTHLNVPLIEVKRAAPRLDAHDISRVPLTTLPNEYTFWPGRRKIFLDNFRESGAQAVFNGWGGDEILYYTGKNHAPIDYIKKHGIRPPLFRIIMEASRMQRRSVWAILPKILRGGFGRSRYDMVTPKPTGLVSSGFQDMLLEEEATHPWMVFRDGVTPGKLDHIEALVYGTFKREDAATPDDFFESLFPYLSQPIIETCLRIPLWLILADGKNRGLARKAFNNHLPQEVIWRGSKMLGGKDTQEFARGNIEVLKTLLLDGELVNANILDRNNIAKVMNRDHDIAEADFFFLHFYMCAELWARKVKGESFPEILSTKPVNYGVA